ncbi:MAG: putative ATP-grasp-modified RiPP [Catenulispora sp.]|nr:putative ATP-grasp-modified RiPP [Catenulispora sp.]
MRQVTDRLPIAPAGYTSVVLDADTQTATYTDAAGAPIEMGEHGTNKTKGTTTTSGGSDGDRPQPATNDDNNVDYESD